jgi:hypothetical protein
MKCKPIHISQERLKSIIGYDQSTGVFVWKVKVSRNTSAGEIAGYHPADRYGTIRINRRHYFAHRLAWFYIYGTWPEEQVDHINKDKTDNRIDNLRLATHGQNIANQAMRRNNTSGYKGVCLIKKTGKWRANIMSGKRKYHIGHFDTKEEAHEAYQATAKKLHGEFVGLTK